MRSTDRILRGLAAAEVGVVVVRVTDFSGCLFCAGFRFGLLLEAVAFARSQSSNFASH